VLSLRPQGLSAAPKNVGVDAQILYMTLLYRFASAIANADGTISKEKEKWLADIINTSLKN
jgi:hypothetical protein